MATDWQVGSEGKTLNVMSNALVRQLRGGSGGGGGGGGGGWSGGGGGYYYGSSYGSSSSSSYSDGESDILILVILVAIIGKFCVCLKINNTRSPDTNTFCISGLFAVFYCCAKGDSNRNGMVSFDKAVSIERERGQISLTATALKPTKETRCGIGIKMQNRSIIISSIDNLGLFANSELDVGMVVKSINNESLTGKTSTYAVQLLKNAVGQITITVREGPYKSVTATVYKPIQQMRCGIGMKMQNGSITISSIHPEGLFANTRLDVGMIVKTINNVSLIGKTPTEATQLIKDALGQVIIVTGGPDPSFETYSGNFDMSYVDRGKHFQGIVTLQLKNNGRGGYIVAGTTSDADGSAVILEGLVTYEGDAYWLDEVESGNDRGLKVLTTGKFDWSTNTFQGTWRASTGQTGRYTSFQCNHVTKTFPSATSAVPITTPVATAVFATPSAPTYIETPVVTAVTQSSSPVVVAKANKITKDMSVGIGIKAPEGTPVISSINPNGLFAASPLNVGMDIQSINDQPMSGKTATEATQIIKDAVGEITIVAGWNLSLSTPITAVPMAMPSAPPAEPEVYVPSYP